MAIAGEILTSTSYLFSIYRYITFDQLQWLISHNGTCNQFTHVLHVQKKLLYEFNYKCTPQLHQMPQVLPRVWASVIPVIRSAPAAAS